MATRGFIFLAAFLYSTAATATHVHRLAPLPPSRDSLSNSPFNMGSAHPLQIQLSAGSENSTLACTIRNSDPDHAISFLLWDTPFDPTAKNTGVLTLRNAETGAEIPSPGMKLNRQMPPSRDAVVEIAPKSSSEREISLSSPWIPTDGGKYLVGVEGTWRAVWRKPAVEITDDELTALKGDEAMRGGFSSKAVEMTLG